MATLLDKEGCYLSSAVVKMVREALHSAINRKDEECERSGCMCDLRGDPCSQYYSNILHEFDAEAEVNKKGGKR